MAANRGKHAPQAKGRRSRAMRDFVILTAATLALAVPVLAPIVLSASDLIAWAHSIHGLGLALELAWFVFVALDALALACILLSLYCAIKDEPAGLFGAGVWLVASVSAAANYRFGMAPDAPPDRWWFFPLMSYLGPAAVHGVVMLIRRRVQKEKKRRGVDPPKFGMARWLPVVGAPLDTYGARRTAQILLIAEAEDAIRVYHDLCPTGSLRVVRAVRLRHAAEADQARAEAAREVDRQRREADRQARSTGVVGRVPATTGPARPITGRSGGRVAAAGRPTTPTVRSTVDRPHRPTTGTDHTDRPTDHSPAAVENAKTIRARYPHGLPDGTSDRSLREQLGWSHDRARLALAAYRSGADLVAPTGADRPTNGHHPTGPTNPVSVGSN